MSGSADNLIERRRLRRRLAALRLAVLALVLLLGWSVSGHRPAASRAHVDVLTVSGLITDEPRRIAAIDHARHDPSVKAMILAVDSPGGTVAGGENLHDALARFGQAKPLVTVMGGEAASAAYMISVPSRRIFASEATLTGSIGVILESPDVSGLLDRIGVHVDQFVSGPLKGQPSVTSPISPAGRDMLQGLVADLYGQFVRIVADGRHMSPDRVRALADGRPYTGEQALPLGLIDQIGDRTDARHWLAANAGVPTDLPTHDVDWQSKRERFGLMLGSVLKTLVPQGLMLDGALALWQGPDSAQPENER